jgi:lipopolysaccharide biosynthesis regulator YciM
MTDQFKMMIVSISGYSEKEIIDKYVDNMPAKDSRYLRSIYKLISPNVKIKNDFTCNSCGYEQELEVPFGADFFWPDA